MCRQSDAEYSCSTAGLAALLAGFPSSRMKPRGNASSVGDASLRLLDAVLQKVVPAGVAWAVTARLHGDNYVLSGHGCEASLLDLHGNKGETVRRIFGNATTLSKFFVKAADMKRRPSAYTQVSDVCFARAKDRRRSAHHNVSFRCVHAFCAGVRACGYGVFALSVACTASCSRTS